MFSKIKLATKLLCFIAPIMIVVMGAVFTWIIKKEESFIRSEITKKAEALTKQLEIIRGFIADKQDLINTDLGNRKCDI